MNPHLEDLAQQASYTVKGHNGCVWGTTVNLEKFALLIVRECLEQIYSATIDNSTDDWDQGYNSGLNQAAETIKTHFGGL